MKMKLIILNDHLLPELVNNGINHNMAIYEHVEEADEIKKHQLLITIFFTFWKTYLSNSKIT